MNIIHSDEIPKRVPDWATQLSELTRIAWTDADGHCHFPYLPLTRPEEWETQVFDDWACGRMHSWVLLEQGRICSHAALLNKGDYWELGRLVAHKAPRGGTRHICEARLRFCREHSIHARMECTQAHTRAQAHAATLGMRFAGIGFLEKINNVHWDIIFFDTLESKPFHPEPGFLANPLGQSMPCRSSDRGRLKEIEKILSTETGGTLPPTRFHILPELEETVREIIRLNLS